MAGHSHWAGIKHKKEIVDQKRGRAFAKLLSLVSAAAKTEPNPDFNPRLRTAVEKAREANVPADKIGHAIKWASDPSKKIEELVFEAYGPGGAALIIEATSDNRNKTVSEIKKIVGDCGGKWAEPQSVRWTFEEKPREAGGGWKAKFPLAVGPENMEKLRALVAALHNHDDVQRVFTNALPE